MHPQGSRSGLNSGIDSSASTTLWREIVDDRSAGNGIYERRRESTDYWVTTFTGFGTGSMEPKVGGGWSLPAVATQGICWMPMPENYPQTS